MPTVLLAVGHGTRPDGSHDPGAVGAGWTEQTAGDVVVDLAAQVLRDSGFDVIDESHSSDPNFVGTTRTANERDVDLVVSVHHDWTGGVSGFFGFWYPGSTRGERATRMIVGAAEEAGFDIARNWVKARGDLYILRHTRMPATLIECGRIGDYTVAELRRLGHAIAAGVAAFFGVPLRQPKAQGAPHWEQVVVYDPATDGRDLGAATVLAKHHRLRLLKASDLDTADEAYLIGKAASTAVRSRYDRSFDVAGDTFEGTALRVARWVERLVRK